MYVFNCCFISFSPLRDHIRPTRAASSAVEGCRGDAPSVPNRCKPSLGTTDATGQQKNAPGEAEAPPIHCLGLMRPPANAGSGGKYPLRAWRSSTTPGVPKHGPTSGRPPKWPGGYPRRPPLKKYGFREGGGIFTDPERRPKPAAGLHPQLTASKSVTPTRN